MCTFLLYWNIFLSSLFVEFLREALLGTFLTLDPCLSGIVSFGTHNIFLGISFFFNLYLYDKCHFLLQKSHIEKTIIHTRLINMLIQFLFFYIIET